jgi:ketosteroid isomerase-like protein
MSVESSRQVAERYCEAWSRGDVEAVLALYDDGFELHYFGASGYAGDHRGKDAAVRALAAVSAEARRELLGIDEILASDDGAVVVARERLTRSREPHESHEIRRLFRYRIAGGRFTECWLYDEDQVLVDRLWGTPPTAPRPATS